MRQFIVICLIAGMFLSPYGCASSSRGNWSNETSRLKVPPQPPPKSEPKIQSGDTLIVSIWEHPELGRERIVSVEGMLRLPLLGELRVTGLTVAELEKTLTKAMAPYIKNPVISVEHKAKSTSQQMTLLGAVNKPGNYEFPQDQEVKLLTLLGAAGGYNNSADLDQAYLFRDNPADPKERAGIKIDLENILNDPAGKDITLRNNDVIILEGTSGSQWNTTVATVMPTLQLIAVLLGIFWVSTNIQDRK